MRPPHPSFSASRLAPYFVATSWAAAVVTLGAFYVSPAFAQAYALYPLVFGIVLFGLPHGALDHLVPARLGLAWGRRPLPVALYLFGYAALVALYLGVWALAPQAAFVGFLLLTVLHWGQGDERFLEIFLGRRRPTRWGAWVTVLVRGGLPIIVPVLAFPETAERFYQHAASGLGFEGAAINLSAAWLVTLLGAVLGAALVGYVVNAVRAAPNTGMLLADLLELALLAALFALVPAYFAVGVYFALWHALRHLARLLLLGRPESGVGGGLVPTAARLALELLPITLVALALLGGFYAANAARVGTLEGFVALYLVLISALTLPHAVVVALMDVWGPARLVTPRPEEATERSDRAQPRANLPRRT